MNISIMFICCVPLTYFQMFGRNLFTVNCNEDVTVGVMMQYMMGMVQSGSWTLFDNTDRLTKGTQHHYFYTVYRKIFRPSCFILAHHCHWVNFKLYKSFYFYVFLFFLLEEEIWIESTHFFNICMPEEILEHKSNILNN